MLCFFFLRVLNVGVFEMFRLLASYLDEEAVLGVGEVVVLCELAILRVHDLAKHFSDTLKYRKVKSFKNLNAKNTVLLILNKEIMLLYLLTFTKI